MTDKTEYGEIITAYAFQFHLNPLRWLEAVGAAMYTLYSVPAHIYKLADTSGRVIDVLWRKPDISVFTKLYVSIFTFLLVLFWIIPKTLLYVAAKILLLGILVEFTIKRFVRPLSVEETEQIDTEEK